MDSLLTFVIPWLLYDFYDPSIEIDCPMIKDYGHTKRIYDPTVKTHGPAIIIENLWPHNNSSCNV